MYLSVVCTNTRFDVQIQIWITNNIQKNSSIVIVKLLYIHDLVFLIDYSFTVERFVHNRHEDTSYSMYTYCDRSFRKNYECIYLSFSPFATLFVKKFVCLFILDIFALLNSFLKIRYSNLEEFILL